MKNTLSLLDDTLKGEGLIPEIFGNKVFTNNFLIKLQQASPRECYKQITSKMATIISKTLKDRTIEDGIKELYNLVTSENIPWRLVPISQSTEHVANVMASSTKGMDFEQMYELKYKEYDRPIVTAVTARGFNRHTKSYTVISSGEPFRFEDIGFVLGQILLCNGLLGFISKNQERCEYVFLKTLSHIVHVEGTQLRGSEEIMQYVETLNKKFEEYISPVTIDHVDAKKTTSYIGVKDIFLDNFGIQVDDFKKLSFGTSTLRSMFVGNLLLDMHQISESVISFVSNTEEAERTYAASYELKKNIPDTTMEKMKTTYLNSMFSEIEIDELMDLSEFEEVEREYAKYAHMFPTFKSPSLRFRRLGKHKAAGLYFAYQKAVCIDFRCTTSMIHELSHWLDYNYRALIDPSCANVGYRSLLSSNDMEFWQVSKKYITALDNHVNSLPVGSPIRNKYYGNTKYNRGYYTDNAEIFARLSEMYFDFKFGESILWKADGFAYPKDDELLTLAIKFFDRVFNNVKLLAPNSTQEDVPFEEVLEKVASSKNCSLETETVICEEYSLIGNQFSFF